MALVTTLNTEFGDIVISQAEGWSGDFDNPELSMASNDSYGIEVISSSKGEDPEEATVRLGFYRGPYSEADAGGIAKLLQFAAQLVGLINDALAEELEAAAKREDEERQEREAKEAERQKTIKEREEILLMELLGEEVKIRHCGYKTMCYGRVQSYPLYGEDGDRHWSHNDEEAPTAYKPRVRWTRGHGSVRGQQIETFVRLDTKTDKGWRTIWDDGEEDLPEYDRKAKTT